MIVMIKITKHEHVDVVLWCLLRLRSSCQSSGQAGTKEEKGKEEGGGGEFWVVT